MAMYTPVEFWVGNSSNPTVRQIKVDPRTTKTERIFGPPNVDWKGKLARGEACQSELTFYTLKSEPATLAGHVRRLLPQYQNNSDENWRWSGGYWPNHHLMMSKASNNPQGYQADYNAILNDFESNVEINLHGFLENVFIAEIAKAAELIAHPCDGILRLLNSFLKQRNSLTQSKELANSYLQLELGIKPLLSDIDSAMESLAEVLGNEVQKRMMTGKELTYAYTGSGNAYNCGVTGYSMEIEALYHVYCKAYVSVIGHYKASYTDAFYDARPGLRYKQLVNELFHTVWELTRFSFLVDYVFRVDRELTTKRQLTGALAWSFVRVKLETKVSYRLQRKTGAGDPSYVDVSPVSENTGVAHGLVLKRRSLGQLGEVPYVLHTSQSSKRLLNILAILRQQF